MASDSPEPEGHPVPVSLPPSLDEWLAERADAAGIDRGELLVQLAATYRAAAEDGDAASELVSAVEEAATDAATERVDDRLGSFRSSLDSQLQAIRKRVVQLKRETDEKAEASRVTELSTRVGGLEEDLDELEDSVGTLRTELEALHESVEGNEASTEEGDGYDGRGGRDGAAVDPELVERLDDIESKLVRVARAVVELRNGATAGGTGSVDGEDVHAGELQGTTLRELKRTAVREGIRDANCGDCGGDVDLALLPDATCPHCEARFRDLAFDPVFEAPRLAVERDADTDADEADADSTPPPREGIQEDGTDDDPDDDTRDCTDDTRDCTDDGRASADAEADGNAELHPGGDGR